MTKLFDTALPPLWYVAMWLCGVVALYFAIRYGIAHGLRDAGITDLVLKALNVHTTRG